MVEDDPETLAATVRLLRGAGHETREARSGADAWRVIGESRPHLVLLDAVLPDTDGRLLARRIKQAPEFVDVFVVLVSALGSDSEGPAQDLGEGADGFIARPAGDRELLALVHAMLRIREAQVLVRTQSIQQAAVAELSHWALTRGAWESLTDRAAQSVADTLRVAFAGVQTAKAVGGHLAFRGPSSVSPDSVRARSLEDGCSLLARRVLRANDPITLEEMARGADGAALRFISGQGFRCGLGLPLRGKRSKLGALVVLDDERKGFKLHEVHFLQSIANVLSATFERLQAEESLKESRDLFRQLAENLEGVFWLRDVRKRQIIYLSPRYEALYGRKLSALQKDGQDFLQAIHPDDRAKVLEAHARQDGGEQTRIEYRVLLPGGGTRWMQSRGVIIPNASGKVGRVAVFAEDVTSHKEMERELTRARKFESTALLAGGVAQDVNNLLGVILGSLSLAKLNVPLDGDSSPLYRFLSDAESVTMRAADLTSQFVTFVTGGDLEKQRLLPWEMVSAAASALPMDVGVPLETVYNEDCWAVEVDPAQIGRMFSIVITIAMEAMPEGGTITFRMSNTELNAEGAETLRMAAGRYVRVSISDEGPGMARERLEKTFDPHGSSGNKGSGKGPGLGLSLARSVVERHGGSMQMESRGGGGTTFHIYLPAALPESVPPDRE